MAQLQNASRLLELTWLTLTSDSLLIARPIHELKIRSRTGVSVVGVIRDGELYPNPDAGFQFAAGDSVAVMGNSQQLTAFQNLSMPVHN